MFTDRTIRNCTFDALRSKAECLSRIKRAPAGFPPGGQTQTSADECCRNPVVTIAREFDTRRGYLTVPCRQSDFCRRAPTSPNADCEAAVDNVREKSRPAPYPGASKSSRDDTIRATAPMRQLMDWTLRLRRSGTPPRIHLLKPA